MPWAFSFDAPRSPGQHLVGAAASVRVERVSQGDHGSQVFRGEELGHEFHLLDADPVFPRDAHHAGRGLFAGLASPVLGCRYHSLVVERATLPADFEVTAWTDDGTIMAIEHRHRPLVGIQFHPESILTDCGYPLLAAFLRRAGARMPTVLPTIDSERTVPAAIGPRLCAVTRMSTSSGPDLAYSTTTSK